MPVRPTCVCKQPWMTSQVLAHYRPITGLWLFRGYSASFHLFLAQLSAQDRDSHHTSDTLHLSRAAACPCHQRHGSALYQEVSKFIFQLFQLPHSNNFGKLLTISCDLHSWPTNWNSTNLRRWMASRRYLRIGIHIPRWRRCVGLEGKF